MDNNNDMYITKWEYCSIDSGDKEGLARLGLQGWEAYAISRSGWTQLKRPCGRLRIREKDSGTGK